MTKTYVTLPRIKTLSFIKNIFTQLVHNIETKIAKNPITMISYDQQINRLNVESKVKGTIPGLMKSEVNLSISCGVTELKINPLYPVQAMDLCNAFIKMNFYLSEAEKRAKGIGVLKLNVTESEILIVLDKEVDLTDFKQYPYFDEDNYAMEIDLFNLSDDDMEEKPDNYGDLLTEMLNQVPPAEEVENSKSTIEPTNNQVDTTAPTTSVTQQPTNETTVGETNTDVPTTVSASSNTNVNVTAHEETPIEVENTLQTTSTTDDPAKEVTTTKIGETIAEGSSNQSECETDTTVDELELEEKKTEIALNDDYSFIVDNTLNKENQSESETDTKLDELALEEKKKEIILNDDYTFNKEEQTLSDEEILTNIIEPTTETTDESLTVETDNDEKVEELAIAPNNEVNEEVVTIDVANNTESTPVESAATLLVGNFETVPVTEDDLHSNSDNSLLLVDGNNLLLRGYFATAYNVEESSLKCNVIGQYVNAIELFVQQLGRYMETYPTTHIVVCFDNNNPFLDNFRKKLYPQYKGTREEKPVSLIQQLDLIIEVLDTMKVPYLMDPKGTYEADDLIGSLVVKWKAQHNGPVYMISNDKDLFQLLDRNVAQILKKDKDVVYSLNDFEKEFNISTEQWIDVKAILGDKSDNIPGISGVGDKYVYEMLQEYKTLEGIYENLASLEENPKYKRYVPKFKEQRKNGFTSKFLATIIRKVDIPVIEKFTFDNALSSNIQSLTVNNLYQLMCWQ